MSNKQIENLKILLGKELLVELFDIFNLQMEDFFNKFPTIFEKKNFKEMAHSAHKIKSSAGNIGANEIQKIFQKMEFCEDMSELTIYYENLKNEYVVYLDEMENL